MLALRNTSCLTNTNISTAYMNWVVSLMDADVANVSCFGLVALLPIRVKKCLGGLFSRLLSVCNSATPMTHIDKTCIIAILGRCDLAV